MNELFTLYYMKKGTDPWHGNVMQFCDFHLDEFYEELTKISVRCIRQQEDE